MQREKFTSSLLLSLPKIMLFLILLLAFLAGTSLAQAVAKLLGTERRTLTARLAALPKSPDNSRRSLAEEQLDGGWSERFWTPLRRRTAAWGLRLTPTGATARLRSLLARAGTPNLGVGEFAGLRVLGAALGTMAALLVCFWLTPSASLGLRILLVVFGLVIGLTGPETRLQQAIRARETAIRRALPEVIDLLVVSVEAGMSLDGALGKVTEKMSGPLAEELAQSRTETELGKTRAEALKDMAARLEMREIKTFVAAVTQTDSFGTSIVRVLRAQSVMARAAKVQAVREQAARLPVTLLFPLIFFIFPAVFVVLLGPSILRLTAALGGIK